MKKTFSLILTCIALVATGMAQPKLKQETPHAKSVIPPKPATHPKGADWYEPDTVYIFNAENLDPVRRVFMQYDENGNCILNWEQYFDFHFNKWVDDTKTTFTFDEFNNRLGYIQYNNLEGIDGQLELSYQEICTYNAQDNMTQRLAQRWESGQWINVEKEDWSYDTQNNLLEYAYSFWESELWKCSLKNIYEYDAENNKIVYILQSASMDSPELENLYKTEYKYDYVQHVLREEWLYSWDAEQWGFYSKWLYFHDTQKNVIEELKYDWESEQWVIASKFNSEYDGYNNIKEIIYRFKHWETGELTNTFKENFSYNTQNKLTETLSYSWEADEWLLVTKKTSSYDAQSGLLEEEKDECRDWGTEQWYTASLTNLFYDVYNNIKEVTQQSWDWDLWQLGNPNRQTYTYDENNNAIIGICQILENGIWVDVNDILKMHYNNMQASNGYVGLNKITATYIKTGKLSIQENKFDNTVKLYPNPVTGTLHIETNTDMIPEVKIYSMQGALLIHAKDHCIDFSSFASGIYIANINGQSYKIVKQ